MAKNYDIARFQDADGLTPQTVRKLNRNFERLLGISTQEALAPVRENSSKALSNSDVAASEAASAKIAADNAQVAANAALTDSARAAQLAGQAADAATAAEGSAASAAASLAQVEDAVTRSAEAAASAQADAASAQQDAALAQQDATAAAAAARSAESSAADAASDATDAASSAADARHQATVSAGWADEARLQAASSAQSAHRALKELATVQDVAGTLEWITSHGTMAPTQDTQVDPSAVYFVLDPDGAYTVGESSYSIVESPRDSDISTYYELQVSQSINNYVYTHLVASEAGLLVMPQDSSASQILISTGTDSDFPAGTHILDQNGKSVGFFGSQKTVIGRVETDQGVGGAGEASVELLPVDGEPTLKISSMYNGEDWTISGAELSTSGTLLALQSLLARVELGSEASMGISMWDLAIDLASNASSSGWTPLLDAENQGNAQADKVKVQTWGDWEMHGDVTFDSSLFAPSGFALRIPPYNGTYRRLVFSLLGNLRLDASTDGENWTAEAYFATVAPGGGVMSDYIIKNGSNSNTSQNPQWRWIKFASGYAIAWGYYSGGSWKAENAWGSLFYNETTRVSNPAGLWVAAPYEWMQPRGTNFFWCVNNNTSTASQTGTYYLISPTKQTTARPATLNFLQIGRWK